MMFKEVVFPLAFQAICIILYGFLGWSKTLLGHFVYF